MSDLDEFDFGDFDPEDESLPEEVREALRAILGGGADLDMGLVPLPFPGDPWYGAVRHPEQGEVCPVCGLAIAEVCTDTGQEFATEVTGTVTHYHHMKLGTPCHRVAENFQFGAGHNNGMSLTLRIWHRDIGGMGITVIRQHDDGEPEIESIDPDNTDALDYWKEIASVVATQRYSHERIMGVHELIEHQWLSAKRYNDLIGD